MKHCESTCTKNTRENYNGFYKNHLQYFYNTKLKDLTPLFVQGWFDKKLKDTSPYVINNCRKLLKASFNYALKLQLIQVNPFTFLEPAKEPKVLRNRFSIDEMKKLLEICKSQFPEYYLLLCFGSLTGMRVSEYLAIKKEEINFGKLMIPVREQYYRGEFKPTKTIGSTREVYFGNVVLDAINFHCKKFSIFKGYLFPSKVKEGFPISYRAVDRRFKKLLRVAGYTENYMRVHDLRGQFVDIQHSQHIPTVEISRQVGHSSTRITNDIYSQILQDTKTESQFAVDRAFGG